MRMVMKKLKSRWVAKSLGTVVGADRLDKQRLTHAMFADGSTSVAKSRQALASMIKDLNEELAQVGLKLNAGKCEIQCIPPRSSGKPYLAVQGMKIPIQESSTGSKILGAQFFLVDTAETEFENRISAA